MAVGFSLTDIILVPALIGYTIWWAHDLRKGARVRRATLALHLVVYGLAAFYVWAVSLGEIVLAGGSSTALTWVWTLVLSGVGVTAAEVGMWYGENRMVVEHRAEGGWHYRGPIVIALFWLSLYGIRFGLEDGVLGGYSVFLPPGLGPPAGVSLETFIGTVLVVASLYLFSFGFLLGISISIWQSHRRSTQLARGSTAPSSIGARSPSADLGVPSGGGPILPPVPSGITLAPVTALVRPGGDARAPSSPAPFFDPVTGPPPSAIGPCPTVARCPACGTGWPTTAAYCGQCGQPLPTGPPPS